MDQYQAKVIQSYHLAIPTIGYFTRNVYISNMQSWQSKVVLLMLLLGLSPLTWAQDDSYILQTQSFKAAPSAIKLSPDASLLLAGFTDGTLRLMDPESFQVSMELENVHFKEIKSVDISSDMEKILSAGHNKIRLWDRSGNKLDAWERHATTIWNAEFSENGLWAVSSAFNKTFLLWDVKNSSLAESMRGHSDICLAVSISPDNRWVASGSKDQTIKIWNLESREHVIALQGPSELIYDLDFSPDSRLLAASSQDETVRIYSLDSKKLLHILKGHQEGVMKVDFSPDGRYLLSASADQSVILWDVQSGELIYQFLTPGTSVTDLVFHPDGRSFFSASSNGVLARWALHPEIFVLRYFEEDYLKEISADPAFEARRKGESKKDFQSRLKRAAPQREKIVDRYYQLYLQQSDH